jgi:RND family efflux transporter MFP subunit
MTVAVVTRADFVPGPLLPARITVPNPRLHVISARETAVVLALSVSVGDRVEQGDTIALLESPAFVARQQELLQTLSQRDLARELAEREEALAAEGVIAGRRGLESRARLRELESRLDAQRQALVLSGMNEADLRKLARQRAISSTLAVRSSFPGIVLEQSVRVGERVDAGAPLYRLGQIDELHVEVHAPLERARDLQVGSRIEVVGSQATGRVIAIGREVHPVDQGIVVRGALEDPDGELRPGQFVRVQLSVPASGRDAYRIPSAAVVRVGDRSWVFVAEAGGFRPAAVEILGGSGRSLVISGPALDGASVVVRGTASLKSLWLNAEGA